MLSFLSTSISSPSSVFTITPPLLEEITTPVDGLFLLTKAYEPLEASFKRPSSLNSYNASVTSNLSPIFFILRLLESCL